MTKLDKARNGVKLATVPDRATVRKDKDRKPVRKQTRPVDVRFGPKRAPENELGRLNVARSPSRVLDRAYLEALFGFTTDKVAFYDMSIDDAAASLRTDFQNTSKIDSPLQNLSLRRGLPLDERLPRRRLVVQFWQERCSRFLVFHHSTNTGPACLYGNAGQHHGVDEQSVLRPLGTAGQGFEVQSFCFRWSRFCS